MFKGDIYIYTKYVFGVRERETIRFDVGGRRLVFMLEGDIHFLFFKQSSRTPPIK